MLASVLRCHLFDRHHNYHAMISQLYAFVQIFGRSMRGQHNLTTRLLRATGIRIMSPEGERPRASHLYAANDFRQRPQPRVLGCLSTAFRMSAMNLPDLDPAAYRQTLHVSDLVSQLQEVAIHLDQADLSASGQNAAAVTCGCCS